ncbi:MAG: Ribosomal protein S5 [Chloroflexi bacterium]|jgi:small subunit ribosomal protein S5|nr:MAG: Ribosomal protein S5 [Chloroflexota bacterium]
MSTNQAFKQRIEAGDLNLTEKVIQIRRVSKVVKGGRRMSFNAMVVLGDGDGHVGIGLGRATAVPDAVRKGTAIARRSLIRVARRGNTVPHETIAQHGPARVLIKPASAGTGLIAGGAVRAVLEQAGIKDVISKCLGSRNPINVAKATLIGLASMRDPAVELARRKGIPVPQAAAAAITPPAPEVILAPREIALPEEPAAPVTVEAEGAAPEAGAEGEAAAPAEIAEEEQRIFSPEDQASDESPAGEPEATNS